MSLTKASYSMISGAPANVLDFGADSTGVADSTSAIQAAISSGAKTIYFPAGTYLVGSGIAQDQFAFTITSANNLSFIGDGQATIKCKTTLATWFSLFDFVSCSNITVKGLRFNGDAFDYYDDNPPTAIQNGYRAFSFRACSYVTIEDCDFTGFYESCIFVRRLANNTGTSQRFKIVNNFFHELGNHGVGLVYSLYCVISENIFKNVGQTVLIDYGGGVWGGGGLGVDVSTGCNRIVVSNNLVDGASGGFKLESGTANSMITGNNIGSLYTYSTAPAGGPEQWYGIKVNGDDNIVSNNILSSNSKAIFLASGSDNCIVQGNKILSTALASEGYGIYVEGGTGNVVQDNRITACASYGILASGLNTVIDGNSVSDCALNGIRTFSSDNMSVKNNQVFDNTGSGIYLSTIGAATQYAHVTGNYCYDTGGATQTVGIQYNDTDAPYAVVFSNYGVGQGDNNNRIVYGTAAPVAGDWQRGDVVMNTLPSGGGTPGWICVSSGTPGTWKAMANVAA